MRHPDDPRKLNAFGRHVRKWPDRDLTRRQRDPAMEQTKCWIASCAIVPRADPVVVTMLACFGTEAEVAPVASADMAMSDVVIGVLIVGLIVGLIVRGSFHCWAH